MKNETFLQRNHYCHTAPTVWSFTAAMLHNRGVSILQVPSEEVAVAGESSSIQKSSLTGWVGAGVWLDFVLGGMVVGSVLGLAYLFLAH